MQYSYSFDEELQQEWRWSERFAAQPEILAYARHVADRFDLRRDIRFDTRVEAAAFDEARRPLGRDAVRRRAGIRPRVLVMATGCLSAAREPAIPGLASFAGPTYHTGAWPQAGVDFAGPAGRRHRHGLVRHPGDPRDRRGGRAPDGVPADAELLDPGRQRAARSGPRTGLEGRLRGPPGDGPDDEVRHDLRFLAPRRALGRRGGAAPGIRGALVGGRRELHARLQRPRRGRGRERDRRGLRARAHRGDRGRPAGRRRPVAARLPDRHEAHLPRHALLRDLQPAERRRWSTCGGTRSRASSRTASARRSACTPATPSSSRPGSTP